MKSTISNSSSHVFFESSNRAVLNCKYMNELSELMQCRKNHRRRDGTTICTFNFPKKN